MEQFVDRVLPHFVEYPLVLLALYVLTLFYPRKASYFYSSILALLVLYGLYHFNDRFEENLHSWLTTTDVGTWFYSFFAEGVSEVSRDDAELAFTAGVYFMAKVGILITLIAVPFAARNRVKEAIGNIGRRPAKNAPPVI